jgi:hypothetical protein
LGAVAYFWGYALDIFAFALALGGKCLQNPGSKAGGNGGDQDWTAGVDAGEFAC